MKKLFFALFFGAILHISASAQTQYQFEFIPSCWDNTGVDTPVTTVYLWTAGRETRRLIGYFQEGTTTTLSIGVDAVTEQPCEDAPEPTPPDFEYRNRCDYNELTKSGTSFIELMSIAGDGTQTKIGTYDLDGNNYTPIDAIQFEGFCEPDLELIDTECYGVQEELCDYVMLFPAATEPQVTRSLKELWANGAIIPLNYPYMFEAVSNYQDTAYTRFYNDLAAYLNANNIPFSSVGPKYDIRISQTTLVLEKYVQTITNPSTTFENTQTKVFITNCSQSSTSTVKVYRDIDADIRLIIDENSNILTALPAQVERIKCDLELLEKECYQVLDSVPTGCNYRIGFPTIVDEPFDPLVRAEVIAVYFENNVMNLPNYPYITVQAGSSANDIELLAQDIEAFYIANNFDYVDVSFINQSLSKSITVIGTNRALTSSDFQVTTTAGTKAPLSYDAFKFECQYDFSSDFYSLYRDANGMIQIITNPQGIPVDNLPPNSMRIECCQVCGIIANNACEVQRKTIPILLTNERRVFEAGTYYSISIWHIKGTMRYQVDSNQPIDFESHFNFKTTDVSSDNCKYKESRYEVDTGYFNEGGQALIHITY